jgi:PAS domain S-box-containing protein
LTERAAPAPDVSWQTLFDTAPVGLLIAHLDGQLVQCNAALARMLGYTSAEMQGMNFRTVTHPEDIPAQVAQARRLAAGEIDGFEITKRYLRKDGSGFSGRLVVSAVRDAGRASYALGMVEDITDRLRADEELRLALRTRQDLQSIVNRSPMVVFLWRVAEGWPVEFVSENVRQFGYTAEDFTTGRVSWVGATHPEDVPRLEAEVAGHIKAGTREFHQEYRLITRSGETRWIDDHTRAIADAHGVVTHFQGIIMDVTAQREVAEALRRSREELRGLSQRMDEMREEERAVLAREIHDELGHALTSVKLDVAWLMRNFARGKEALSDSQVMGRTQVVLDTLDRAIGFTRDLSSRLRPGILDHLGLVATLEWLVQDFGARSSLTCEFKCSVRECALGAAEATAVFRICQELLTNVARHAFATRITVGLREFEGGLLLEVTDNGRGISADKIESGRSLGLVGIRERMRVLGGEFRIVGQPGRFTRARVWVPIRKGETTPKAPELGA